MRIVTSRELGEDFFSRRRYRGEALVRKIVGDVRREGDVALRSFTKKYDGVAVGDLRVCSAEIKKARNRLEPQTLRAMRKAMRNIKKFSEMQMSQLRECRIEIEPGVRCGQRVIPLQRIGIYVPAGKFPLFSTLLMCAVPARVAGVGEIAVFSPPSYEGTVHPLILAAAALVGIDEVYRVGGAQAIAAMAYGTQTIRGVEKIVGPGNRFVTLAKREVFGEVGIDFLAGPTENLIVADDGANPSFVAADLLAQAEHDIDARVILLTDSRRLAERVREHIDLQLEGLQTRRIAEAAIKNGTVVILERIEEAPGIANRKAPEHLELHVRNAGSFSSRFTAYGSLFIGAYSAEALGDYCSGVNHTLPTNGAARYTGGLGVRDFVRLTTTLEATREGMSRLGDATIALAEGEGLEAHARSVCVRTKGGRRKVALAR